MADATQRSMVASPLQMMATVVAVAFLVVGSLGFVPGVTHDYDQLDFAGHDSKAELFGLFQVSMLHNIVHLALGAIGLAMVSTALAARNFLIGGGAVYLALWAYGLAIDAHSDANFVPLNNADDWLHFGLGPGWSCSGPFWRVGDERQPSAPTIRGHSRRGNTVSTSTRRVRPHPIADKGDVMTDQNDVVSVLTHDHREVEELFDQIERTTEPGLRRDLTDQVITELVRHSVAEEQYLYPAVREHIPDGDALADKEIADHHEVEEALKALEEIDTVDPKFLTVFRRMSDNVKEHVQEEEHELFPKLRQHTTTEELRELGEKVQMAKKVAPTRPHPSAPDTPPLNKILGPGAGFVDRVRDKLSGRAH